MLWAIANQVPDRVLAGWFSVRGVRVEASRESLRAEIGGRMDELRARFSEPAKATEVLEPGRRLYRALGIDPTRRRPSSEALIRRILQGKGLYEVNTAVDAANLTSLHHFRSVGLYDAAAVLPFGEESAARHVVLRLGDPGESYPGIRKDEIHLEGRPALFDGEGPFGNPSADSDRTKVTEATTSILYVIYELPDETGAAIGGRLEQACGILLRHLGGEVETRPSH